MYARSTTVHGSPEGIDQGVHYVRETVIPALQQMEGYIGISMLCDRETGRCIVTSAWADAGALRASAAGVVTMRRRFAEIMGGEAEVDEWEIAVLHRMHESPDGACSRVIWTEGDPAQMDRTIDTFRMSMLPRIEELPGFCSCSVMVDRETGRCATSVTYDSRQSMDEAQTQGIAMREEFIRQMGMETTEVAAFDVALAHLRVPETV